MSKIALVFIGPPGSGKGTQANLIAEKYQIPIISSGEIYRKIIKQNDQLALTIKKHVDSGGLVPDELHATLIDNEIKKTHSDVVILDGVIRNLAQKITIEKYLAQNGFDQVYAVNICLTDLEAQKRMKLRGRGDDQETVIINRLKQYHQETDDVIAQYRQHNQAIIIDGRPNIESVHEEVENYLENILHND